MKLKAIAVLICAVIIGAAAFTIINIKDDKAVPEPDENETAEEEPIDARADEILSSMTLEEKINQLFIITPEALTGIGQATAAGDTTRSALEEHPVGGLIYFTQNFVDEAQTKEMITNTKKFADEVCKLPLFISVDEEGGTVARLGNSESLNLPKIEDMSVIGQSRDMQKAYETGSKIAKYLKDYGFNMDFAPVADALTNPQNEVIGTRSFSADPTTAGNMAVQLSKGLNDNGIISCYKHFPGHGATLGDTHEGFAYTDKSLDELMARDIIPFKTAIENNADFIMVGHISLPNVTGDNTPASVSPVIITDILKNKLGYKNLIITDALNMGALTELYSSDEAAVRAINAGADMLLMPQDFALAYNGVLDAVNNGSITEERINASVKKIIMKKLEL